MVAHTPQPTPCMTKNLFSGVGGASPLISSPGQKHSCLIQGIQGRFLSISRDAGKHNLQTRSPLSQECHKYPRGEGPEHRDSGHAQLSQFVLMKKEKFFLPGEPLWGLQAPEGNLTHDRSGLSWFGKGDLFFCITIINSLLKSFLAVLVE